MSNPKDPSVKLPIGNETICQFSTLEIVNSFVFLSLFEKKKEKQNSNISDSILVYLINVFAFSITSSIPPTK